VDDVVCHDVEIMAETAFPQLQAGHLSVHAVDDNAEEKGKEPRHRARKPKDFSPA